MEICSTCPWTTPVSECFLITRRCPTPARIDLLTTQQLNARLYHGLRILLHDSMMSQSRTRTMPASQQCSLIIRRPSHCVVWQPESPKYVSRHTPFAHHIQQRKILSTTHRVLRKSSHFEDRCTRRNASTTAWHTRRRSLSRLGLVGQTTTHITRRTQFGSVQVVPVSYRRHLASLIVRIGSVKQI